MVDVFDHFLSSTGPPGPPGPKGDPGNAPECKSKVRKLLLTKLNASDVHMKLHDAS